MDLRGGAAGGAGALCGCGQKDTQAKQDDATVNTVPVEGVTLLEGSVTAT